MELVTLPTATFPSASAFPAEASVHWPVVLVGIYSVFVSFPFVRVSLTVYFQGVASVANFSSSPLPSGP